MKTAKPVTAVKSVKPLTPAATSNPDSAIRLLKTATCSCLYGKGKLGYQICCDETSELQFRVTENTGGGFFNNDLVSWTAINQVLAKSTPEKPITSFLLQPLYRHKSQNSPGFLLAALKNEGLVLPQKGKLRRYERVNPGKFLVEMKALMNSTPAKQADAKSEKKEAKPKPAVVSKKGASKANTKKKV